MRNKNWLGRYFFGRGKDLFKFLSWNLNLIPIWWWHLYIRSHTIYIHTHSYTAIHTVVRYFSQNFLFKQKLSLVFSFAVLHVNSLFDIEFSKKLLLWIFKTEFSFWFELATIEYLKEKLKKTCKFVFFVY